jgi:rubrerythrin
MKQITCPKCSYKWKPKILKPKQCPMCKQYLNKVGVKKVIKCK